MDLLEYVNKYQNLTFEEKSFNDVESAILSMLVYSRFEDLFDKYNDKEKIIRFDELTDEDIDILSTPRTFGKENGDLLHAMCHSKRYKDIVVQHCEHVSDIEALEQFLAITYNIPYVGYYICFRGTDGTLIGWKENLSVLYNGATLAQLDAIEYLYQFINHHPNDTFMISGHSKGGNLAMYSLFFSPNEINQKITKVYSFDGFGFADKKFRKVENYDDCVSRLIQIVPRDSIVGELFYTPLNPIILDAYGEWIIQHHPMHWLISDDGEFITVDKRRFGSRLLHRTIKKWSQRASKKDLKIFVEVVTSALEGENGKFEVYGEKGESKFKRILKAVKRFSFGDKLRFIGIVFLLIWILIASCFYYLFHK